MQGPEIEFRTNTLRGCNIDVLQEGEYFISFDDYVYGGGNDPKLYRFIGRASGPDTAFLAYVEGSGWPIGRMRFASGYKVIQAKVKITVTGLHPC